VIGDSLVVVALSAVGAAAAWLASGSWSTRHASVDPTTPARAAVLAYLIFYVAGSLVILLSGESAGAGPLLGAGALAAFGLGAVLARRAFGPPPVMPRPSPEGTRLVPVLILAGIGLAAIAYLIVRHGIPMVAADPLASRAGFAGLIFDLFRWLVPPAALVALSIALTRDRPQDRWIATFALLGVGGLEVLLASRALPLELAIEALLIVWWAGRWPSKRVSLGLAAAGLTAFVGIQLVRGGPEGGFTGPADAAAFAVRRTVDRVVLIHPRTLDVVATTIPEEEPYFGGSTYIRRLGPLLGQEDRPSLGYWLYERLFPGQPGGFAAPGVAVEAWANAGPILVAIVMAALGALAIWLGVMLGRLPGGPTDRAFAAIVVVAVARTYATNLNGFLLTLAVATAWWLASTRPRPAFRLRSPRAA
jgi:hypothetical protein